MEKKEIFKSCGTYSASEFDATLTEAEVCAEKITIAMDKIRQEMRSCNSPEDGLARLDGGSYLSQRGTTEQLSTLDKWDERIEAVRNNLEQLGQLIIELHILLPKNKDSVVFAEEEIPF